MGTERPERVYAMARVAYVGAVQRLRQATTVWAALQVPLDARSSSSNVPLPGWTQEQYDATVAVAQAWVELLRRRREYTSARRTLREGGWR